MPVLGPLPEVKILARPLAYSICKKIVKNGIAVSEQFGYKH